MIATVLDRPIMSPWEANTARHTLALATERCGVFEGPLASHVIDASKDVVLRRVVYEMRRASVVLWSEDLRRAATNGADLFKGRTFDVSLLRFYPQLWIYPYSLPLDDPHIPDWYGLRYILLFRVQPETDDTHNNSVAGVTICTPRAKRIPPELQPPEDHLERLRPRLGIGLMTNGTVIENWVDTAIAAQLEFMNLEIVAAEPVQHSRQVRRAAERENRPLPDLRVITLRRQKRNSDGKETDVDWSCRWLVGGHWRNQWYPSTMEHKPVYIVPYVKGPENKPFRENHAEKIFVVER